MAINFYEGKENKPNRLFIQADKTTIHDRIIFAEAYYSVDDKAVHFYGLLHSESIGIENSKDKAWKVDGMQKVIVSFWKTKKPTWNNETRKFEDKEVESSENYLYGFAKDVLESIDSDCVSAVIAPYVNPQFLEETKKPDLDATTIAYWEAKVKNTIVVAVKANTDLTEIDKGVLTAITSSSFSGSGKTYQKAETETEKLEARFEFLKRHLGRDYSSIATLHELGILLTHVPSNADSTSDQLALAKSIDLIVRMWQ
ncbi:MULTISPECIES: hypothetical protein [unclassified Microcoleus]|uniref:hypothetical protein n=1 Tax=unclassified Microcoleus TaxID=2642155 RepID=UPI002FCFD80E